MSQGRKPPTVAEGPALPSPATGETPFLLYTAQDASVFLAFNEYRILDGRGRISKKQADRKALAEYAEFNKTQKIESDFDRFVKERLRAESGDGRTMGQIERQVGSEGRRTKE